MTQTEQLLLESFDEEELVALTRDLVRIDSVIREETGNTEAAVVAFVAQWIRNNVGGEPVVEEVVPGRENIIFTVESGRPGKTLMLEAHTDVVSEGEREKWTYDPFGGEIADGRIYGRGSCDMKAGLAVNLITAKTLFDAWRSPEFADLAPAGTLRLGIVCDEEGMMVGIKNYIEHGYADDVDACLVSEPEENQLCITMKGGIRAVVRVTGRMAHGAMPLTGINAGTRMARIILAFEEFEREEKARCGEDALVGWPSITPTVVQSPPPGEPRQLNVMPGSAIAYYDIRTTPLQDHDTVRKRLEKIIADLAAADSDFHAEIEFIEDRPVVSMERDEPIVREAARAYRDVTGRDPVYNGVPGATDGTFLRAWKGVPSLVNGPGPRHKPHQTDEYVEISELVEAARIYVLTAARYLS